MLTIHISWPKLKNVTAKKAFKIIEFWLFVKDKEKWLKLQTTEDVTDSSKRIKTS